MVSISIIRHPKERRSKCTLTPLEGRDDCSFYRVRPGFSFDVSKFTILGLGAPELTKADAGRPLLLLDSTWRLLPQIESCLYGKGVRRTLPSVLTAYPRVSKLSEDPLGGLASIEALYLAKLCLGEPDASLLKDYHWRDQFLESITASGLT